MKYLRKFKIMTSLKFIKDIKNRITWEKGNKEEMHTNRFSD